MSDMPPTAALRAAMEGLQDGRGAQAESIVLEAAREAENRYGSTTFEHAAALYGLGYEQPTTTDRFQAALGASLGSGRTTIIEIRTDRVQNLALHRRLADLEVGHSSVPDAGN